MLFLLKNRCIVIETPKEIGYDVANVQASMLHGLKSDLSYDQIILDYVKV